MLAINIDSPHIETVDAQASHVALLRQNLRPNDANEILRLGVSIEKALWRSYRNSVYRKSAFIDGKIAAMWGVIGSMLTDEGTVWLLTSPEVYKISPLKFCRIYQEQVKEMLKIFPVLSNYVDIHYVSAIRLLENTGFKVYDVEPIGLSDNSYHKFEIGK